METKTYPPAKPYRKGYLRVGKIHEIYFELCGNRKGLPVMFVHGGPGAGCSAKDMRFFNPKKFNVLLFDQRGSNRSRPFAETKENKTQYLIEDMKKLLHFLGPKKAFLVGGSWGSTLSLAFAIKHPEMVSGMLLRSIFIPSKEDNAHYLQGGVGKFFPETWGRFISFVPEKHRKHPDKYYLQQMQSKNKKAWKYAYEWSHYELSILKMAMSEKEVKKYMQDLSYKSMSVLEAHYLSNNCFLPKNFIFKNIKKIRNTPTAIVHGRYDMICIPKMAFELHKKMPKSKLYYVVGGHSASEKSLEAKLTEEMDKYAKNQKKWPN